MSSLLARVEKGRLMLDEPTTLPEGTVLELVADDEGDDLSERERRALHDALSESWRSALTDERNAYERQPADDPIVLFGCTVRRDRPGSTDGATVTAARTFRHRRKALSSLW